MAWTKAKTVILSTGVALLIIGAATTTHLIIQHRRSAGGISVPNTSWAYSGYATPESALESTLWAMTRGNPSDYVASLAPGGILFKDTQGKSDDQITEKNAREMAGVASYRILNKQIVSADEVILTVKPEGNTAHGKDPAAQFVIQKIGNEWKLAGPAINNKTRPGAPQLQLDPNRPSRSP